MYYYLLKIVINLHNVGFYIYLRKENIVGKKLLEIMRDKIRFKHYSIKTEQVYLHWSKRYILFHNKRHPKEMGKIEIEQFLTHLVKRSAKLVS
jgi:hypothetical protein